MDDAKSITIVEKQKRKVETQPRKKYRSRDEMRKFREEELVRHAEKLKKAEQNKEKTKLLVCERSKKYYYKKGKQVSEIKYRTDEEYRKKIMEKAKDRYKQKCEKLKFLEEFKQKMDSILQIKI